MKKTLLILLAILALLSPSYAGGYLKQSTATTININLVKISDNTGLTGATVASISMYLFKHSDTSSSATVQLTLTASGGNNDCVEKALGVYNVELTASNTDTLGRLDVTWAYANAATLTDSYMVVAAATYDNLVTNGLMSGAAMAELSQGVPPATPTPAQALMGLWMAYRNTLTTTSSYKMIRNDAGTVVFKFQLADDGTTFTQTKAVSGP